jgi:hypothetical protein
MMDILKYGHDVEVVLPTSLRFEARRRARDAAAIYKVNG